MTSEEKNRQWTYPLAQSRQALQQAEQVLEQLREQELQTLATQSTFEYREEYGNRILTYFPDEYRKPLLKLVRTPDGRLTAYSSEGVSDVQIELGEQCIVKAKFQSAIRSRLLHRLTRALPAETLETLVLHPRQTKAVNHATGRHSAYVAKHAAMQYLDRAECGSITVAEAMELADIITRERMLAPGYLRRPRRPSDANSPLSVTLEDHNEFVDLTPQTDSGDSEEPSVTYTTLHYAEGEGYREIRFWVDQEGRAQASVRLNHDDQTIEYIESGEARNITLDLADVSITNTLQRDIAQRAMRSTGGRTMAETAEDIIRNGVHPKDWNKAQQVLERTLGDNILPEGFTLRKIPEHAEWCEQTEGIIKAARAIIGKMMVDPDIEQLAMEIFGVRQRNLTTNAYNHTAINLDIFRELYRTNPTPLRLYCAGLSHPQPQPDRREPRSFAPYRLTHMGEVIALVRQKTALSPREWTELCRCDPAWFGPPQTYTERLGDIRIVCRSLAAANRPEAVPEQRKALAGMAHYAARMTENPEVWQGWILVLNRWLNPAEPGDKHSTALTTVADAMTQRIELGEGWGSESWEGMHRRALAWEQRRRTLLQEQKGLEMRTPWESVIDKYDNGEFTFRAVTMGKELVELGDRMNNCLGNYTARCAQGKARIFTATQTAGEGKLLAAVELGLQDNQWLLIQTEGPDRKKPGAELQAAAGALALAYTQRAYHASV